MKKNSVVLNGLVCVLVLSGCSKIDSMLDSKGAVNYQQNQAAVKGMEIPPDLTAPEYDSAFAMPENGTISVAEMQRGRLAPTVYNPAVVLPVLSSGSGVLPMPASQPDQSERAGDLSSIKNDSGEVILQVHDTYSRALVLTDIILERLKFAVQRRDQSTGVYHVQYNGNDVASNGEKGFLSGMFKRSASKALAKGQNYQVQIKDQAGTSIIRFRKSGGQLLSPQNQTQVMTLLNNAFNR